MTPRERVRALLAGNPIDRYPLDLGGFNNGMITEAYLGLKHYLGIPENASEEKLSEAYSIVVGYDERVLETFSIDFRRVFLHSWLKEDFSLKPGQNYPSATDQWGVGLRKVGFYAEMIDHPLTRATVGDLADYPWPDPGREAQRRVSGLRDQARRLYEHTEFALVAGEIGGGLFEYGCWLRGMERFLIDLVTDPDFARELIDAIYQVQNRFYDLFLGEVGEFVDVVEIADDYGTQNSLLLSPALYREYIKEPQTLMIRRIKDITGGRAGVKLHSCGAVSSLIPDLVEAGVDILNPVQPLARGMAPRDLLPFSGGIIFHGGVDEQYLLPFGYPQEIEQAVASTMRTFRSRAARYILSPAHTLQVDVPPRNIEAMFQAGMKYGRF